MSFMNLLLGNKKLKKLKKDLMFRTTFSRKIKINSPKLVMMIRLLIIFSMDNTNTTKMNLNYPYLIASSLDTCTTVLKDGEPELGRNSESSMNINE